LPEEPEIYAPSVGGALRQGELICWLQEYRPVASSRQGNSEPSAIQVTRQIHPYSIVMSQDCDLEQDFLARWGQAEGEGSAGSDKLLPNIIFCEVAVANELRSQEGLNSALWRRVQTNTHQRYQYLSKVPSDRDQLGRGIPELGIDFKKYFTIPTPLVYEQLKTNIQRRCRLVSPFLEHLCTRFSYYQFRIALPVNHS
jgi:hypothetical protein